MRSAPVSRDPSVQRVYVQRLFHQLARLRHLYLFIFYIVETFPARFFAGVAVVSETLSGYWRSLTAGSVPC